MSRLPAYFFASLSFTIVESIARLMLACICSLSLQLIVHAHMCALSMDGGMTHLQIGKFYFGIYIVSGDSSDYLLHPELKLWSDPEVKSRSGSNGHKSRDIVAQNQAWGICT